MKVSPEAQEVLDEPFPTDATELADHFLNRCKSTTTALCVLAAFSNAEFEDETAAEILLEAAAKMAEHEARTR